jgi:DAK2 domain fusion protein YloV
VLDHLDARAARRWVVDALEQLSANRDEIDALNVYPVPDSDTGTNMCLTVEAGAAAVEDVPDTDGLPEVTDAFARGALLGARGSSGVILSQLLRGWAEVFHERPDGGPAAVRAALARAADQAYAAVARPVEGTMLTVARAAAAGAQGRTLREVVTGAVDSARTALARTTEQLDVLGRAGVVDAGGRGLLVVLESLSATVHGRTPALRRVVDQVAAATGGRRGAGEAGTPAIDVATGGCDAPPLTGPAYEVMYLLDAADGDVPAVRAELDAVGEALVVVGGGGLWNVHVHTDDVAAAIRAGQRAGHLRRLRVTSFARQRYERQRGADLTRATLPVVVDVPPEVASLVVDHGAQLLPRAGGDDASLASHDLDELLRSLAGEVGTTLVLVPASRSGLADATAVARALVGEGRDVRVLPTRSFVQALAAVSVHDATLPPHKGVARMAGSAGEVRWGALVVRADHPWRPYVVGSGDDACVSSGDLAQVAYAVVRWLFDGAGELLTVLPSGDPAAFGPLLDAVLDDVRAHHPEVEVVMLPAAAAATAGLQLGVE